MAPDGGIHTKIAIVGAGFGGLGMAIELKRAGEHDFLILEKGPDIGGVWRDNTYPGCTCDVPSHLYSFSFAPYRSCTQRYAPQQDILSYLQQIAADNRLQQHLRFDIEISEALFQTDSNEWVISTTSNKLIRAEIVIFAVGQLHKPHCPDIPGMETFSGQLFHSANWNHDVDLCGKRVSVIGTGSSAAQMLPALASAASELTVYQREPHWVLPKPDADFGCFARLLLRLPGGHAAYRSALSHGADMLLSPVTRSDALRRVVEWYARRNLRRQIGRKDLIQKLMPSYPIGGKRIVFDNRFYRTLTLDNVRLITEPIASVNSSAIKTQNHTIDDVDVIICATGFKASEFLLPIHVRGRDGHSLNADWAQGAQAFMGLAVYRYPNLFMIAGPNTFNPAGSNPEMKELQVAYILRCLRWKESNGAQAIEVRREAAEGYQAWLKGRLEETVWSEPANSWYRHESGKVTSPWPASRRAFARMLRDEPQRSFRKL
ncbi:hypothetical protein N0V87_008797 [Didymella glomerata]|uniref:Uncharacterized protein n=1 Tax=Didymella glomerata TaxID=749621 RepID=A0A9W9BWA3_9PLEO|nr:hypothetical protein N0V87_008797 [Didymella glomerata]